ncbi:MAG: hypothetical protein KI790_00885 [Cyclobacteriaceae bacterium]|nr:hypothetical protein [Cyclobacteriaceae bacterium HetDA_MAG_MS6]
MKNWCVALSLLAMVACDDIEDCQLDPNIGTFSMIFKEKGEDDLIFSFDSVKMDEPDLLLFTTDTIEAIQLPLNYETNSVSYTFFTDSIDYTLNVAYENRVEFYDIRCDPNPRFFNLRFSSEAFDSLVVLFDFASRQIPETNIEIYL